MRQAAVLLTLSILAGCAPPSPSATPSDGVSPPPSTPASPEPSAGAIEPPLGSASVVYEPNPGAIVVAVDAGHGGCLDWGVPDPSERGVEWSEKAMTLAISQRLRDLLEADGIEVVMIRDSDDALAGDEAPDFGCTGPAWRDVDGDGRAGFEASGRVRTRDELQARIDLANLVRADVFVSIHINSLTENGVPFEIAATQTFFDDETTWGVDGSGELAEWIQDGIVKAIEPMATYDREDRGTEAVAFYAISRTWADGDTCEVEGDEYCKPHRGTLMPSALIEAGSITLRAEHDLLASAAGQDAVAAGIFDGIVGYFADRPLAARIAPVDEAPGAMPLAADGTGPPFRVGTATTGTLRLRVTNTGTEAWAAGSRLVAGWTSTDQPYLPAAPSTLTPVGDPIPALEPGASVVMAVSLPAAPTGRAVAWVTLSAGAETLADLGSPALQLATAPG